LSWQLERHGDLAAAGYSRNEVLYGLDGRMIGERMERDGEAGDWMVRDRMSNARGLRTCDASAPEGDEYGPETTPIDGVSNHPLGTRLGIALTSQWGWCSFTKNSLEEEE
jgi:hypothetical protein